ncbi:hypothetical protein H6P81_006126 [Aristolochia fimbriata]|uniref:Uncharacterized protein n=1 Tax=Aristolochia fimbriata TaxID=158543 RepID=A0AAV7EZZ8_ARIFI|nr:hypothetical protein H6P81_006126 [Aristolochia fimbriata]
MVVFVETLLSPLCSSNRIWHCDEWTFLPFFFQSKKFYTVILWCRIFAFLVASQTLRIITFYATQLPGPNYHCHEVQ